LPSLQQKLIDKNTHWSKERVRHWYGCASRTVEFCSGTAIWYHGGLPPASIRWVLIRDPHDSFDPIAMLSTDPQMTPLQIITAYVRRWQVEVTFEESRAHLGVETQRQWSDLAIARSTPTLLALFSIVTLMASRLAADNQLPILGSSWYQKPRPTFSDALAAVRRHLWAHPDFFTSISQTNADKIPSHQLKVFAEALCYAA
jgi:hypothetical protein